MVHETAYALYGKLIGEGANAKKVFHYSDMLRDGRRALKNLASAVDYAHVGGTGYWKSDAGFFDSASSGNWEGQLAPAEIALFNARLAELVPDAKARTWLLAGDC